MDVKLLARQKEVLMVGLCKKFDCVILQKNAETRSEVTPEQYIDHCRKCTKFLGATKYSRETPAMRHR